MSEKTYMSLRDKINYGIGNFGTQFVMTFIGSFILIFLTDTVGLKSGVVGTLMAVSMAFDGLTDVFFGAILDRTHTKWGKARPWMLIGILPLVICEVMLFMVPQAASENMKYAYFFVFYTMLNAIFYTIVAVSYNTLTALVTKNESERVQIGVIGFMLNFVAAMLIPSTTPALVNAFGGGLTGWRMVAIIFAVIATIGLGITAITAKELPAEILNEGKEAAPEKMPIHESFKYLFRNKYFFFMLLAMLVFTMNSICFTSSGTYFAKYILQNENMMGILTMTTMAPMIVALLLTPVLVNKFGLFKVVSVGQAVSFCFSVLALICAVMNLFVPMLVCFVIRSLFMGPFAGTQNALTAEICEYSYLKDKVRIDGTLFSCISVGSKVGNGLSTAIIGWILQLGASSWNTELAYAEGAAVAMEADACNVTTWYAPGANIHRSPYGGRDCDYYSEDALISGSMAASVINGGQDNAMTVEIKHFAVNEQETARNVDGLYTWVNEQALREIYLKPFEIAVKTSGLRAIMSSFNRIGATWTGASHALLTEVLRDEWGYVGMVETDAYVPMPGGDATYYMMMDTGIRAGNDLWLQGFGTDVPSIAVNEAYTTTVMREACHRILYSIADGKHIDSDPGIQTWQIALIAASIAVYVLTIIVFYLFLFRKKKAIIEE